MKITRKFTEAGKNVYGQINWAKRSSRILVFACAAIITGFLAACSAQQSTCDCQCSSPACDTMHPVTAKSSDTTLKINERYRIGTGVKRPNVPTTPGMLYLIENKTSLCLGAQHLTANTPADQRIGIKPGDMPFIEKKLGIPFKDMQLAWYFVPDSEATSN